MTWTSPIPLHLVREEDSEGFREREPGTTGLPVGDAHPGAFGFRRANHVHEGIDLYCDEGTPVFAVEDGVVVAIIAFTGPSAEPPSPWWHDTKAILVEGESGVVVYGEVAVGSGVHEGVNVGAGEAIGHVVPVLKKDKGRPVTMLHLELHRTGARDAWEWPLDGERPATLLDPTKHLLATAEARRRMSRSTGGVLEAIMAAPTLGAAIELVPNEWRMALTGPDALGCHAALLPPDAPDAALRMDGSGLTPGRGGTRHAALRAACAWLLDRCGGE